MISVLQKCGDLGIIRGKNKIQKETRTGEAPGECVCESE